MRGRGRPDRAHHPWPYVVDAGELGGGHFAAALERCARAVPLGLLRDGHAEYAPAPDTVIGPSDGVIVLAADRAGAHARRPTAAEVAPTLPSGAPTAFEPAPAPRGHALIVGWSQAGHDLVRELGGQAGLTILASLDAAPAGVPQERLRQGDPSDADDIAQALATVEPAIVVLLGGANGGVDSLGAHARAALGALKVSRMDSRPDLAIIVEQYASAPAQRLREADPRIRVISRAEIVAHTLLLSSTDRLALRAHEALALDGRYGLEAVRYRGDPVPFPAAFRALLDGHAVPLMMSRDGEELDVLDGEAAVVRPGDGLLMLRRTEVSREG